MEIIIYAAVAFGLFATYCKNKKFRSIVDNMSE